MGPCHIVDGYKTDSQHEEHTAGLGIEINDKLEVVRLGNGQCKARGVEIGYMIVGINGKPVVDCVKAALGPMAGKLVNAAVVGKVLKHLPKPYTLDFNAMPSDEQTKKELDATFTALLQQGIEVAKVHQHGNFFNRMARRVVFMNDSADKILVAKTKNENTDKIISVTEVTNVGYSENNPDRVVIQTVDESKDVTISLPSANANKMFAQKLYRHCSSVQEDEGPSSKVLATKGPLSPRLYRKTSTTTSTTAVASP